MNNQDIVSPADTITRYITNRRHYASTTRRVKYNLFMPYNNPVTSNLETSVYRVRTLTPDQIWCIGLHYVAIPKKEKLRGRADLTASSVFDKNLEIKPHTAVHRLHANIVGWPVEKNKQMLIAQKLADSTQACLFPKET
jgi:hypothetical protein